MILPFSQMQIREAADFVTQKTSVVPRVDLIVGSDLAELASAIVQPAVTPCSNVPLFVPAIVEGHSVGLVTARGR